MRLGEVQTQTFIAGIANTPVIGSTAPVLINGAGQLGIQFSSSRYKRDIQPMGAHSRGLLQLRPVIFRYKQDAQGERQYGLIAEEVAKVYPELVTRGATGDVEAVRYHEVIPMLLNEVQHQHRQLAELKAQNVRLQATVVQQQEREAALAARLERLEAAVARAGALASR
jgi:polyhydroxyalkanoate synthesis regulator phasin